jgi:predicted lipoprotein
MSAIRWAHSSKGLIIRCELTEKANVSIEVFSLSGKKVASIVNACETPGAHEYAVNAKTFEPSRLAQTMYLVKVAVGNYCETKNEFIGGQR